MGLPPGLRVVSNPPNPWHSTAVEYLGDAEPPLARLRIIEDATRSILAQNSSPDLPFRWSLNPYRGCYHACAYCYARPQHEYLGLGAGTDFERTLVVKPHAAELLVEAFERPSWRGEFILFSGDTDCYQPLEASYGLTRACLAVCARYANPCGVITKSPLIERDLDLLVELSKRTRFHATISIPLFDPDKARALEPYVASPARRLRTIERLASAGLDVGVSIAPMIPGLGDEDIAKIMRAARAAGARRACLVFVRLPGPVAGLFEERLRAALPLRADKVLSAIRAARDGKLNQSRFGERMRGSGHVAGAAHALFEAEARRLGFEISGSRDELPTTFTRPNAVSPSPRSRRQLTLF
ncbi:MAG: radical SAM protein [Polyangiaceae bacterium]